MLGISFQCFLYPVFFMSRCDLVLFISVWDPFKNYAKQFEHNICLVSLSKQNCAWPSCWCSALRTRRSDSALCVQGQAWMGSSLTGLPLSVFSVLLLHPGRNALALVTCSPPLTGRGVLVPTAWDQMLVCIHQNEKGIQ